MLLHDSETSLSETIEQTLAGIVHAATQPPTPEKLAEAIHYAVFPGGARIRPMLCLAVAHVCRGAHPQLENAAAAALELLHCASLVHDDLSCFDNAAMRRGKPSVHKAFGEALAVLTGDSLIMLAVESVARTASNCAKEMPAILLNLCSAVGCRNGLIAGQAQELGSFVVLETYHAAKTGALFEAAAVCGALAAGTDGEPWRDFGRKLGRAYQVADDIADVIAHASSLGKPTSRDSALGRPNFACQKKPANALAELQILLLDALDLIPAGTDPAFREWLRSTMNLLLAGRLHWSLEQPWPEYCELGIENAIHCILP